MIDFYIRESSCEDVDEILALEQQYGIDVYSRESIISTFNYDYYYTFVIVNDNKVIGYISATIIFDECNLLKIIVDQQYRGKGYGKLLVQKLIDICKEKFVNKIYLEVRKDNEVAKSFYSKLGFMKETERSGYYDGVDAEIFGYYIND